MGHGTEGKGSRPCHQGHNRFGAPNLRKPVATAPPTLPTVQRTAGGTLMSPELIAARDAEQKRRAQIKADAARPKFQQPSVMDLEAIAAAFAARHSNPQASDYFFNSLWNRTMLDRCVAHNVAAGNIGYDSLGLEAAHKVLLMAATTNRSDGYEAPPHPVNIRRMLEWKRLRHRKHSTAL